MSNIPESANDAGLDHSSHPEFYDYYAAQSLTPETQRRMQGIIDVVLRRLGPAGAGRPLDVLDVGCAAGALALLWARQGHRAHGLDVNAPLLELAQQRARQDGLAAEFRVGTATELPWADASMDVCIVLELMEHVPQWARCLDEACRVLRPGGVLYIATSNRLCPKQYEFNLPFYSWYPAFLKRHYERLAVTTRPDLANYAKYPAVNWFTYFQFRSVLKKKGFTTWDRFDFGDYPGASLPRRAIARAMRWMPPLRWLGQAVTPYTVLAARKD